MKVHDLNQATIIHLCEVLNDHVLNFKVFNSVRLFRDINTNTTSFRMFGYNSTFVYRICLPYDNKYIDVCIPRNLVRQTRIIR